MRYNKIDSQIAEDSRYKHAKVKLNELKQGAEHSIMVMFIARMAMKFDLDIGRPIEDIILELSNIFHLDALITEGAE